MSFEGPRREIDRESLVTRLKLVGIENPDARGMLIEWSSDMEAKAMSEGTREAQVKFELDRATLYWDAGLKDEASEALNDLLQYLYQERDSYDTKGEQIGSELKNEISLDEIETYIKTIETRLSLL